LSTFLPDTPLGKPLSLQALARFDIRFRWLIVAGWIVAIIAANRLLPSLSSVSQVST